MAKGLEYSFRVTMAVTVLTVLAVIEWMLFSISFSFASLFASLMLAGFGLVAAIGMLLKNPRHR